MLQCIKKTNKVHPMEQPSAYVTHVTCCNTHPKTSDKWKDNWIKVLSNNLDFARTMENRAKDHLMAPQYSDRERAFYARAVESYRRLIIRVVSF